MFSKMGIKRQQFILQHPHCLHPKAMLEQRNRSRFAICFSARACSTDNWIWVQTYICFSWVME